ncbi:unnamed protein product [Urochloa decumbens]|uniref:Fucosyltransferase n=1 Tax=Urochloa decumbens TaxID=240449 RepID=A0ABC9DSJ2_9POAL
MGSVRAIQVERDLSPEPGKRRPSGLGTVTAVFLLASPLLLLSFLFGDRALASIAADYPVWQRLTAAQSSGNASGSGAHDRLLGGLLSPDIDAAACLSRYSASRRWNPSPFPASPYLIQKLRQYEANHRRCGPGTASYRAAMAQLMSGRNGDGAAGCKYVVWLPLQGLGNRMLSVVSTFLYALLTGRVLLVHETPEMEALFCEPFPGTSWVLPPDFPYTDGFSSYTQESYVNMLQNGIVRHDDDAGGDAGALPAYVYFHLEQISLRLQNHTFCEEDHRVLDRFNWMVLRSDSYFAVALFLMPAYGGELGRMFPAKGSVFHLLGRYLLHPGNGAWGIVERFYDGYLAGADELLGIQVRIAPFIPMTFEAMYEQITRCAREHELLPQVMTGTTGEPSSAKVKKKKKAVLVVSLKPEYYERLHSVYYTNATATGEVVAVFQPSHDQDQHTEALAHNERALAEIFLLSYSHRMVTSGFSTFGYVAHALAGIRPWLLMLPDRNTMRAEVACVRPASVEPCLHSAPSLVCRAGQDLDPAAHVPFLRRCEDVDVGFKLVD